MLAKRADPCRITQPERIEPMKTTITALLAAAALSAVAVPAANAMEEELTMLELAVKHEFDSRGIDDAEVMSLTLSQIAVIKGILSSDEPEGLKTQRIEQVVARGN